MRKEPRAARLLRAALKEAAGFAFRYSGLTALVRATASRRGVGILVYHDPPADLLRRHLEYLSRHYCFVTLSDLVNALESGEWSRLPLRSIVMTFDDGHRGNLDLVPLFRRYGIQPTIYLCTEPVLRTGRFWFREPGVDPEPLKAIPNWQRVAVLEKLRACTDVEELQPRQALEAGDIVRLAEIIDFQSHSVTHPILPMCSAPEAEREIWQSRVDVERLSGRPCDHFSFPNGDYSEREIQLVKRARYRSARTTKLGWNGPRTDRFRLRIIGMPDVASVNVLAAHLAGGLFVKRFVQRLLRKSGSAAASRRDS